MTRPATERHPHASRRVWLPLLVGCAVLIALVDSVLLQLGGGYFTRGYNGTYLQGAGQLAAFALASLLLDLWLVLGLWTLLLPLARALRLAGLQVLCLVGMLTLALPFTYQFVSYRLHVILGDLLGLDLLWDVAARSPIEIVSQAAGYLPRLGIPVGVFLVLLPAVLVIARRAEAGMAGGSWGAPRIRSLGAAFAVFGLGGTLVLLLPASSLEPIRFGLGRKASGTLLVRLDNWLTDVDGDGFGLGTSDPDPFDASIHPFALDLAGNGVDENGLAGDHPLGFEPVSVVEEAMHPSRQQHVVLIFLESFRADMLGRRFQGREVTPFLDRLAREGGATEHAYVHSPFTVYSRAQLFSGSLVPHPGESTLMDDFHEWGYRVAYFSGQDDSFGGSEALLDPERADVFYDARQDRDRRTSRSTSPGSLQVSWKLLASRVLAFLEGHDAATPLFLYVNIVDTHYPYHHGDLDRIFDIEPVERQDIRADHPQPLWNTYLNTAANVDRAIETVVQAVWERLGRDVAIVITSDHGQSLYDDEGMLGHGRSLHAVQTRVPFVLWGLGGDWPEPLGLGDVRGLLRRNLPVERRGDGPLRPRFVPDPERRVFEYMAKIGTPRLLGLRSLERSVLYDVVSRRVEVLGPGDAPLELAPEAERRLFESLIWNWEGVRLRDEREGERLPTGWARRGSHPAARG
jgi:hypothetical protein